MNKYEILENDLKRIFEHYYGFSNAAVKKGDTEEAIGYYGAMVGLLVMVCDKTLPHVIFRSFNETKPTLEKLPKMLDDIKHLFYDNLTRAGVSNES